MRAGWKDIVGVEQSPDFAKTAEERLAHWKIKIDNTRTLFERMES